MTNQVDAHPIERGTQAARVMSEDARVRAGYEVVEKSESVDGYGIKLRGYPSPSIVDHVVAVDESTFYSTHIGDRVCIKLVPYVELP